MIKPRIKRTHIALFVRDPRVSSIWYQDVLGMIEVARGPDWSFMSFGEKHHDIALIRAEGDGLSGQTGLQHYGLEIDGTVEDLRRLKGMLIKKGVDLVKTADHKVGYGVYFADPDGNRLEFFCEVILDSEEGKRVFNRFHAPSDPLDLDPLFD